VAFLAAMLLAIQGSAQSTDKPTVKAVTFEDVLKLVQGGADAPTVLERCDTVFTLDAVQRGQLSKAGASQALLDALEKKRMPLSDVMNFALILDCSGSMNETMPDGQTKIAAAKKVVGDLIDQMPNGKNVTFLVYGHDLKLECKAVKVVRPLAKLDDKSKEEMKKALTELKPIGHTPIALALHTAGDELAKGEGLCQVVLITDGMETCHGDPAKEAEALTQKLNLRSVEVIGLGVTEEEKKGVASIAYRGRGKFYDAQNAKGLAEALPQVVKVDPPADKPAAKADPVEVIPEIIQALIDNLNDKDGQVRKKAAEALQKQGSKSGVPALKKRVSDDVWYISGYSNVPDDPENGGKTAALNALKALAPDEVKDALVAATRSKSLEVKSWALNLLAGDKKNAEDEQVIEAFVQALKVGDGEDKERTVHLVKKGNHPRKVAAEGLKKLGVKSDAVVKALKDRVADDLWYESGYTNVPSDPVGGGKTAALDALRELAPKEVSSALAGALKSKNPKVKEWATNEVSR
jgi:hypothetical protein